MADINSEEMNVAANVHQEEDDDEEAMSLSDLPLIQHNSRLLEKQQDNDNIVPVSFQEDFDFSCSLSKESDMCAADEVFFQGQIVPLRHSVSSEKGLSLKYCGSGGGGPGGISCSESMDRSSSTGLISSRSSSISSSHQSFSSGSSATTPSTLQPKHKVQKPPKQNHFHSHPSPSPRVLSFNRRGISSRSSAKKSSVWNIFRLGLITSPPEIAFHDFRTRCPNNPANCKNNSGIRNSNASSGSLSNIEPDWRKKSKSLFGGCNCSIDAVETVNSRAVNMKKSGSDRKIAAVQHEQEEKENGKTVNSQKQQVPKKHLSHHRTFEWLKQLSIEGTYD